MEETHCKIKLCDFNDTELLRHELVDSAILVNGTSIGMAPDVDACPIPSADLLPDGIIVSDIIYNPKETKLLAMAREKGLPYFNGTYMLLYQGAEAFRLWTGCEMPVELIKKSFFIWLFFFNKLLYSFTLYPNFRHNYGVCLYS